MAAGLVYHDITTASGVTFSLACWVPDTAAPNVGAIPVSLPIKSDGTIAAYGPGVATPANSLPVVGASPGTTTTGQVSPTGTAGTLLAARSLRRQVTFYNDGDRTVWIGPATVTTANGFPLLPGAAITLQSTALVQAITASGTGHISYIEEY